MILAGASFEEVRNALIDAFPEFSDFDRLARCLDKHISDVAGPDSTIPEIVQALIGSCESTDTVEQLITCAKTQNPANQLLAAVQFDALELRPTAQEVVERGGAGDEFKQRLLAAVGSLGTAGMEALAGRDLRALLLDTSPEDAETLFLAVLGTSRATLTEEANRQIVPVVADCLRRGITGVSANDVGGVDLARAHLPRIDLKNLDLHEADLAFADLRHADLTNANLWRSRAYGVDLTKAHLSRANLEEVRWQTAVSPDAQYHDCRMVSAFFKDAVLRGAEFQRSRLQGAHFERADLTGCSFEQANIADAYFTDATIDAAAATSIAKATNWRDAHLDAPARALVEQAAA